MNKSKQWAAMIAIIFSLSLFTSSCKAPNVKSNSEPVSHSIWDSLLRQHVDENGLVDYKAMIRDSNQLENYLDILRQNHPNKKHWTENETKAYWINAYNAFTVELILRHYPVMSIKDIKKGLPFVNSVWDMEFIKIEGADFDLNAIEHGILRKNYDEYRVHFALVCGSMSCPKLQNFAFTADKLDEQLDEAARQFINEPFRNDIHASTPKLSKILDWYWIDFKSSYSDRSKLVNKYAKIKVANGQDFDFLDYDWTLNEQTETKEQLVKGE